MVTRLGVLLAAAALLVCGDRSAGAVPLTEVINDPLTNPQSQHATAVEPDTFAFGSTIVAVSQVGRYFDGGASGTGFTTSTNGGGTWTSGVLPGLTVHQGSPGSFDRATDPVVAYDPEHNVARAVALLDETAAGRTARRSGQPIDGRADLVGPVTTGRSLGQPGLRQELGRPTFASPSSATATRPGTTSATAT